MAETLDLREVSGEEWTTRDRRLSKSLSSICVDEVPDNEHNTWKLLKTLHTGARTYALIEPNPNDVGYDRFVFVFRFSGNDTDFVTLGVYSAEAGSYHLLSTTSECDETFPRLLLW